MPSHSKCEVSELVIGDEIELYVIASNEGGQWTSATVLATDPLRVRWWDGDDKGWRDNSRVPMIRRKPEPAPPSRDYRTIEVMTVRAADRLFDACCVAIRSGRVDARSPIGDATLDYRDTRFPDGDPEGSYGD